MGVYPAVSLAQARELAREAMAAVARGEDPAAVKAGRGRAKTVGELVDRFVEGYAKRRQKGWQENERVLVKDVAGVWGKREVVSITRADVNQLINDIIDRGAPHMSNRVLRYLRVMWNWAVEEGLWRSWQIPGNRRKTGEAHMVPLSSLAMEIISGLPRFAGSPYLFPGPVSGKPVAGHSDGKDETIRLVKEAGHELPDWRWHDLRRTARTNLSRLKVAPHISELVIGHAVTGC